MEPTNWVLDLTFELGDQLRHNQLDMLLHRLSEGEDGWTIVQAPDFSVSFTVDLGEEPAFDVAPVVVDIGERALADVGAKSQLVRIVFVTETKRYQEATAPTTLPELLAAADVAKVLNVSRQRVSQLYRGHTLFPAPVMQTGTGVTLWTRAAVDWFASVWDRRPGRRPSGQPADSSSHANVTELAQRRLSEMADHELAEA